MFSGNKSGNKKSASEKFYPNNKSDLFSAFMEYIPTKTNSKGHIGLVTPFVWMFIKS